MATTPRSRQSEQDPRGRRKGYRRKSNPLGVIVFFLVLGGLAALVFVLYREFREMPGAVPQPAPWSDAPRADRAPPPARGRPEPELHGDVIIQADRLFREAKTLHAEALEAESAGDHARHDRCLADCREKLRELEAHLRPFTAWHAEAKAGGWGIPRSYDTLVRRVEKYENFAAGLPAAR